MNEDYQKDFKKVIRWSFVLVLALTFFLVVLSVNALKEFAYIGEGVYPNRTLYVTGEGEVFATPDVAQFTFTVTEEADSVASAQKIVTDKINAALSSLRDSGVEDKDIKTTGYNAYPRYTYPEILCTNGFCPPRDQVLSGYEVSQTISVKIRDTEKAGEALSKVAGAGISNVSGLQFVIDDQEALIAEARSKAIDDAKGKIGLLADDLGVRVKKVVNFSESLGGGPYPLYETAIAKEGFGGDMAVSSAPQLPTGENSIKVQVHITYEIK